MRKILDAIRENYHESDVGGWEKISCKEENMQKLDS